MLSVVSLRTSRGGSMPFPKAIANLAEYEQLIESLLRSSMRMEATFLPLLHGLPGRDNKPHRPAMRMVIS